MGKVTGLGGLFFKSQNPEKLRDWYQQNLGLSFHSWGGVVFPWKEEGAGVETAYSVWTPFPADSAKFEPSSKGFSFNFRVSDLDGILGELRKNGAQLGPQVEECEFGRFAWVMDPEGNRVELWEPPSGEV